MFDLEAGPLEIGDGPTWPRVFTDGLFESHAADFAESRAGVESQITNAAIDVAGEGIPDEDRAYATLAGPGEDAHAEEAATDGEPLPDATLEHGEIVNQHAAAVAPFLPPPDGDVPVSFADPPSLQLSDYEAQVTPAPTYVNPDNPSEDTQV